MKTKSAMSGSRGSEIGIVFGVDGLAMKLPRRMFLHLAASAAAFPAMSRIASAQTYPTREHRARIAV